MTPRLIQALGRSVRNDFQVLRSETRRLWYTNSRKRMQTIRQYLASHDVRCLHIGAGGNVLEGWLNTDLEPQSDTIIYLDVTDPMPFPDNSLDFIFSEHLFEHIPHEDGAYHLRECCRVLKPKGRMRIATPDLQFLINVYTNPGHTETQEKYVRRILNQAFPKTGFYSGAFVLNHFVKYWGHQFIYDEPTLSDALRRAGFQETRRWAVGESDEPRLRNVEHHGDAITDEFNRLQTIIVEGTKSAG